MIDRITRPRQFTALALITAIALCMTGCTASHKTTEARTIVPQSKPLPEITLDTGWQLQDIAKVPDQGEAVSSPNYSPTGWFKATVPGTVLTTLVNNGVYPEPLYGENDRPTSIPDSLCRTSYWYRTQFTVPPEFTPASISGSISTASTTSPKSGSTATISAASKAPSSAASSTSPRTSRPAKPPRSPSRSCRRRIPARRTSTPSKPAPAETAESSPRTAPHSSAPSAGIGFPPFATATWASGKR